MFGDKLFEFLLLFVFVVSVECTTCNTMDIRNNLTNLSILRDCSEVVGNLKILLLEKSTSASDFDDYVFPNLTKITGYLFFFQVWYLTSIGKLFPNLRSVRGYDLFTDYSIVLYDMPHLKEVGLKNLKYVARGFVKVDKCPQICNADTIDWQSIGTKLHFTNTNNGTCEPCPRNCSGYCWNSMDCHVRDTLKCHQECMGCTVADSPTHCTVCKNYEHNGTCVPECSTDTTPKLYMHNNSYSCLTESECRNWTGTWWIFKNECINECPLTYEAVGDGHTMTCKYCGSNCTKWCVPDIIESIDRLHKLKGCTHINSSLIINFAGVSMTTENEIVKGLADNLGYIRYIRDSLVVTWTKSIRSLSFLRNLTVINGIELKDKSHAVVLRENQILQKLWNFDTNSFQLKINNGTLGAHYNPLLCKSEIRKLAVATGLPTNFSPLDVYANGDKSACNFINLNVTVNATSGNATLSWPAVDLPKDDLCLGFTVYYTEHEDGKISTLDSNDVCDGRGWKSQFSANNSIFLANLLPFTKYAYYIKIYRASMEGAQTDVSHFKTLSDDPEVLSYFKVEAKDYQSIELSWFPPRVRTGVLSYYKLYVTTEPDYPVQWERDFCKNPRIEEGDKIDTFEEGTGDGKIIIEPVIVNRTTAAVNCSCSNDNEAEISIIVRDFHAPLCDLNSQSKFGFDKCKRFLYQPISELNKGEMVSGTLSKRNSDKNPPSIRRPVVGSPIALNISADLTETVLKNFTHFTMYVFYFCACNEGDKCGPVSQSFSRTKKKEDADNIESVKVDVDDTHVTIDWVEPKNPNSMVLSYNIEHQNIDLENSKPMLECLSRNKHNSTNTWTLDLTPGKYRVRVQAVSLAGPGKFSKYSVFIIEAPARDAKWVLPIITITFLIAISALILYMWYKWKHRLDNIHLIATINPDYDGAIYIEDDWEIDRNDIELLNDLGHGTFGTVYCGLIKSRNLSCAIKTVNDNVSLHERMEFLNEASVMKAFSQSHHVVKLIGVVSRGQPPLVVMELMERGDLKKYLRLTRDSSQNITANEIYRMSIEIADGMAYLSAKKFVHRDLAARNCMVAYDRTVKIGDFGMARDVYETDYYRKETKGLLPVRWMAPESLADGIFSSDSDVWSYGIVLWEIATLAEQPYQGLSNEQVLQFVVSKGKLERPPECPDLLFEIMDACWCWRPNDRPTFADIVERLEDHVGQDFKLVSFIHSREGLEHKVTHGCQRAYNPPALGMGAQEHDLFGSDYNEAEEETSFFASSSRPRFSASSLSQRMSSSDLY